ncbi:MAG: hypothetical protein WCP34_01980 [Pseudomonadota bacterium]
MPYSKFTLRKVKDEFHLELVEDSDLFSQVEPHPISEDFSRILHENLPLALAINTEKARSELLISPILVELRKIFERKISLFSGIDFNVDETINLNGFCDFLISNSAEQFFITAPVVAIVEAKNENIVGGMGQCIAEMIAANLFNNNEKVPVSWIIYGAVTTGSVWKFLKLEQPAVFIDNREYHIENISKIMGILRAMVKQHA